MMVEIAIRMVGNDDHSATFPEERFDGFDLGDEERGEIGGDQIQDDQVHVRERLATPGGQLKIDLPSE